MTGGYYLDFELKREEIARYGLAIDEVQMLVESVIGGESITTTVEGRERYPVSVRYARELRDDPERLKADSHPRYERSANTAGTTG